MNSDEDKKPPIDEKAEIAKILKRLPVRGVILWVLLAFIVLATILLAKEPLYMFNFLESDPSIPLSGQIFRIFFYLCFLASSAYILWFCITYMFGAKEKKAALEDDTDGFKKRYSWFDILTVIPEFLVFVIIVNGFFLGFAYVDGYSMMDTYHDNQFVIIDHYNTTYEQGDVVIIQMTDSKWIKRLVAIPGDTLMVDDTGVYVNGVLADDNNRGAHISEMVLPDGYYFVMGDNRDMADDSRDPDVGFIMSGQLLGKVVYPDPGQDWVR